MDERLENLTRALSDAGCERTAIEKAARLLQNEQTDALIRHLRLCRCELMEQLHTCQKLVDRLDWLIREIERKQD